MRNTILSHNQTMNNIISLIAVAFASVLLSGSASAQSYNLNTAVNGGTNNIAATTTNTTVYAVTIPATKSQFVAVQASFKLISTGTSSCVFRFDRSVDGTTWESSAHSLTVVAAGTGTVSAATSVSVGGYGYLRLSSIENPNANAMTNIVVKYSQKTGI